jgi:hypothetical protein
VVGGSEAKKGPGSGSFFRYFLCGCDFELPSPKTRFKKIEKKIGGLFVDLFVKTFRHDCFYKKAFCSGFELERLSLRNTQTRDTTKKSRGN